MQALRVLLLLVLSTGSASSLFAQDALNQFSASLVGKQFILRSFSAESEVHYGWTNGEITYQAGRYLTFGLLTPDKATYSGGKVNITAHRQIVLLDDQTRKLFTAPAKDQVRITVDLAPVDLADALPKLRKTIFFDDVPSAMSAVPPQLAQVVPFPAKGGHARPSICGDCIWIEVQENWEQVPKASFQPPVMIKHVEPEFSDEARRNKISGTVASGVLISDQGTVVQTWLLRPVGSGLDKMAERALDHYLFKPAQRNGSPVGSFVTVETNFQFQ